MMLHRSSAMLRATLPTRGGRLVGWLALGLSLLAMLAAAGSSGDEAAMIARHPGEVVEEEEATLKCHSGQVTEADDDDDGGDGLCAIQTVQLRRQPNSTEFNSSTQVSGRLTSADLATAPDYSKMSDGISAGSGATLNILSGIKDWADAGKFSPAAAGKVITGIGGAIGMVVPPPCGIVAGGALSLFGGMMGLFEESGPTITDVLDKIEVGFAKMNEKLDVMDAKLDLVLQELYVMQKMLIENLQLDSKDLREISDKYATVIEEQQQSAGDAIKEAHFRDTVQLYANDLKHMRGSSGSVGTNNVERAMVMLSSDCDAGDFYKQILAARFQLHYIISLNNWLQAQVDADTYGHDQAWVAARRGDQTMVDLNTLKSDLEEMRSVTIRLRSEEARLRWQLGEGKDCSAPVAGANAKIFTRLSPKTCFFNVLADQPVMARSCMDMKEVTPQPLTKYNTQATFVEPLSKVITSNPWGRLDQAYLCITKGASGPIWKNCSSIEDKKKFKAVYSRRRRAYRFDIKSEEYGCLAVPPSASCRVCQLDIFNCADVVTEIGAWRVGDPLFGTEGQ
mmetsp:Transcript_95097/g.246203  ORF Transcript_95097/g.246203 Transcript_95097/m.246203 type:complete len:565 (+) Transcript_95097:110-1804(+)